MDRQQEQHKQLVLEDLRAAFTNSDLSRDLDPLWGEATVFETDSLYCADIPLSNNYREFVDLDDKYEPIMRLILSNKAGEFTASMLIVVPTKKDFEYEADMGSFTGTVFEHNLNRDTRFISLYHNAVDITSAFLQYKQQGDASQLVILNAWDPDKVNELGVLPEYICTPPPAKPHDWGFLDSTMRDPTATSNMFMLWNDIAGGGGWMGGPEKKPEEKPCADLPSGKANPMTNMKILGSPNNGVKGGDFGTGRGHMHKGIDLDGEIGTPIYAMFDGVVDNAINSHNPEWSYKYFPPDYPASGDRDPAGNRINIISVINGQKVFVKYFHLDNVAINPTYQKPYAKGDSVKAGDVIGYLGKTGSASAYDSAGPHLHLEVRKGHSLGEALDPKDFTHSSFDPQTGKGTDCK